MQNKRITVSMSRNLSDSTPMGNKYFPYILLLLFSAALMLVASNEGWLRMEYPRYDTAWFFMAGKAWMNGLTPYVDFADSKGPLLWILYGIGYLLSPRSLHGMFLIETLFYWGTFIFLYKSILVFTKKETNALLGSMLMALFFFQPWIHKEFRAEDFCQFFNAMAFYSFVCIYKNQKNFYSSCYLLGIAFAGPLLIKYNIALMILAPTGITLVYLFVKRTKGVLKAICWWMVGACILILPFLIYFICIGCLEAFFKEYFFNTFQTIEVQHPYSSRGTTFWQQWPMVIVKYIVYQQYYWTTAIKIAFISIIFTFFKFFRPVILQISIIVWFVSALLLSTYVALTQYLNILTFFSIIPVIYIVYYLPSLSKASITIIGAIVLFVVSFGLTFHSKGEFYNVNEAKNVAQDTQNISNFISMFGKNRAGKPTVMYIHTNDMGMGLPNEVLPASKYWASQAGSTPEMNQQHLDAIKDRRPDFIFILFYDHEAIAIAEKAGYCKIYEFQIPGFSPDDGVELNYLYAQK